MGSSKRGGRRRSGAQRSPAKRARLSDVRPRDLSPASYEARKAAAANRSISLAWDENEALGLPPEQRRQGVGATLTDYERKETLYQAYLNIPWISAPIDTTAKRIVSGGYSIDQVKEGEGNEANRALLEQFILRTDENWDFLQFIESIAIDLGIFGEAFAEIVWLGGKPFALHKIDCLTMNYRLTATGQIIGYQQQMTHSTRTIDFEPNEIIRWWLPSPRASMQSLSFIEKLNNAVFSDQNMVNWQHRFFRQGAKPPYWIETPGDEDEARRLVAFHRENYTGAKNAHIPPVMYGGAVLHEFNKPSVDVDFAGGRKENRDEALAVSGTPPAMVNVIETGNIGGGTGESQHKAFQYNTTEPLKRKIFEKLNYRVTQLGFGITDWRLSTRYADYRDDNEVAKIQDMRVRNGTSTINEERATMGRPPLPKGGDTAIVVASRDIIPVERLDEIADEQRQQAQLGIQGAQAQVQAAKAGPAQQSGQNGKNGVPGGKNGVPGGKNAGQDGQDGADSEQPPEEAIWRSWLQESGNGNTGIMIALYPSAEIARQIALSGSEAEPLEELHVTLAYLGDSADMLPSHCEDLQDLVEAFAANAPPLSGVISGIGRFTTVPDGEPTPFYASVDIPGLPAWRERLVRSLLSEDFPVVQNHGYTPHITLAYLPKDAPMPITSIPGLELRFDTVWLVVGDARYCYGLDRTAEAAGRDVEDRSLEEPVMLKRILTVEEMLENSAAGLEYDAKHDAWQPVDLQARLSRYRDEGVKRLRWKTYSKACEICTKNDGQIVEVGQAFANGNILPKCHPNCECEVFDADKDVDVLQGKGSIAKEPTE